MTLVIANKNYSSWSMRPWVLLHECGIPFQERMLKFASPEWREHIARLSPSGLVPVLWEGVVGTAAETGFATWDTLAISERLHELFPDRAIWPTDPQARAQARSAAAEMHAGFRALRGAMPMNIRSRYPGQGMNDEVAKDLARISALWAAALGPFLCGEFCAADAFYAPVATRLVTYGVELTGAAREYQQQLLESPGVQAWSAAAVQETEFVAEDEPYANPPR
ncbi:MAG: glutathione S-transferase family protein [Betaproteobacteria bacterium]|nr:glutathione S-transferase family protein [Betaproteobacteria bacterium]MSQ87802.1 glutathione S-transferase family protein [Betaproteobacteria bacterium]